MINGTKKIILLITCTLSAPGLKYGHVSVVGDQDEDVHIEPARMIIFNSSKSEEEKIRELDTKWKTEQYEVQNNVIGSFSMEALSGIIGGPSLGLVIIILVAIILIKQDCSNNSPSNSHQQPEKGVSFTANIACGAEAKATVVPSTEPTMDHEPDYPRPPPTAPTSFIMKSENELRREAYEKTIATMV